MSYFLGIVLVGIGLAAFTLGAAYRFLLMPVICGHFGEESRRDWEATRRRREFERNCYGVLTCLLFSGVAGAVRGVVSVLIPEISGIALGGQIALLVIAGVFGWAAINRWREPFAD